MRDRAGAEKDNVIARLRHSGDQTGELVRAIERDGLPMTVRAQALHQRVAVRTRDRRLAGRIDMRDDRHVGIVEAGAELLEQSGKSREAVRLHHGDDLALGRFPRRPGDGRNRR